MRLISINNTNISCCFVIFILLQFSTCYARATDGQEITNTLLAIKKELVLSSSLAQKHETIIIRSEENIYLLKKNEARISEELSTLKYQLSDLTIALQKISSRPIFAFFVAEESLLSVARSINLIKFLKVELEKKRI